MGQQIGFGVEQVDQNLPLIGLRAAQGVRDRQPVDRGDQMQAQTPEPT
jgi:hypothetical protein